MAGSWRIFFVFVLATVVFLSILGQRDIVTSHEARVAETARAMADSGWPMQARPILTPPVRLQDTPAGKRLLPDWNSTERVPVNPWGVPTINGELRLQKPPLPYWLAAALYKIIGRSEASSRLPPAALGALSTLLIFDLARRLLGRRAAWFAALAWVSTFFITDEMRKAMADPYLAFFTLLCVWSWVAAGHRRALLLVFYVSLALGMLAKGPVILLHVGVAAAAYHGCYRRRVPGGPMHAVGALLLLAIVLPWPLYVLRHVPNAVQLWHYESIGQFTGEHPGRAQPWYFYLPQLFELALPWIGLWAVGLVYPWMRMLAPTQGGDERHPKSKIRNRKSLFPLLWFALTVVVFSFSSVKKNAYLLPVMPAQCLLIGQAAAGLGALFRRSKDNPWPRAIATIQTSIGVGFGIFLSFLLLTGLRDLPSGMPLLHAVAQAARGSGRTEVLLAIAALLAGYLPLAFPVRRSFRRWFTAQAVSYGLMLILLAYVAAGRENLRSPRSAAEQVADRLLDPQYTLSRFRLPQEVLFYIPSNAAYDQSAAHILVVVDGRNKSDPRIGGESWQEEPSPFAADVPGRRITSCIELDIPAESDRNPWRVFDLTAD